MLFRSKMWRGYEDALAYYLWLGVSELALRGKEYYDRPWCIELQERRPMSTCLMPPWLGDERLHSTHRANLLRKDPQWYGQFQWTEDPGTGYWWPV